MVDIRPNQLPDAVIPLRNTDSLIVDQGVDGVRKVAPTVAVDSVSPVATQPDAVAGSDNVKRMTSLRTKQSIASEVGVSLASNSQGAKADTAVQMVNGKSGNSVNLDKSDVGLGNVDNTSDANKPVSTAQQTALDLKSDKSVTISSGNGLTGGGDLSASRTLSLNSSSIASLAKADSSVQTVNGVAPTGGNVSVSAQEVRLQNSRSSAILESFAGSVGFVQTEGYSSAGDGGAALYKRVASQPTHTGKFQSADGAWWELADQPLNVKMFGARGDGVTDDWQSITNSLEYCRQTYIPPSSRPFYPQRWTMRFPDGVNGTYMVSQPLIHVVGCTILMSAGATLKASAVMSAVVTSETVNYLSSHHFGRFEGGIIDADNKAQRCIHPKLFAFYTIENTMMLDPTLHYIDLGDASLTTFGIYEAMLKGLLLRRSLDRPPPVNSAGINISKCGDSHFEDIIIMDVERGMNGPLWDSKITRVHVWNTDRENHPVKVGFFNTGGQCIYSQCQVDGPCDAGGGGWYFSQPGNVLLGCSVNGEVAGDNVFQGVYLDTGAFSTVIGCTFKASSGSLSGDILGPGVSGSVFLGNISNNCTLVQGNRLPMVGTQSYTVSSLPTSPKRGDRAFVHDATSTTFASVIVGGGSNWVPVVFNGSNWIVG